MEVRLMRNSTLSLWAAYECSCEFASGRPTRCQSLDNQHIGMQQGQDCRKLVRWLPPFALRACIVGK
jgi:hypothetical protein